MILRVSCTDFSQKIRKIYLDKEQATVGVTLGDGSYLVEASLDFGSTRCHVLVGKYSSIGQRVKFIAGLNHDSGRVSTYPFREAFYGIQGNVVNTYAAANHHQIIIGNDVWIGADVTVLGGVRIGNGAVIGAGAVVAKDVPPYAVVVGNPGKVVKYRFDAETIKWLQSLQWWNWPAEDVKSCWQDMTDMAEFRKKYADKVNIAQKLEQNEMIEAIRQLKSEGYSFYYLRPDILSKEKIWQTVLDSFSAMDAQVQKNILFMEIEHQIPLTIQGKFSRLIDSIQVENILLKQGQENILPLMDFVITTKEAGSSELVDEAVLHDCRIVYGNDSFL